MIYRLPGQFRLLGLICLMAALFLPAALAQQQNLSGPGPNGINIGLDFDWNTGTAGLDAAFVYSVNSTGASLETNGGPASPTTHSGAFVFGTYSVGGVAQTGRGLAPAGPYSTWNGVCSANASGVANNTSPLTMWNCFNTSSFGQIFWAFSSGTLSGLTFNMTCLNPAGTTLTPVYALIYQVNADGESIPPTPLAQTPVDMSACPTLTSWTGHTFTPADFAPVPINFPNVTISAGKAYGVFLAGPLIPGSPLPGFTSAAVPALSKWGVVLLAAMLAAFGSWKLRQRIVA